MQIETQKQLKPFNTLSLNAIASHYVQIHSPDELVEALDYAQQHALNVMILSGGSNMLLPAQINALVVHMNILGVENLSEDVTTKTIRVGAGQVWHDFVLWTLDHNLPGLENLALIPGTVGAAPIQNIGAYGVEVGEYIQSIEAYDCHSKTIVNLPASECAFTYRNSIFKAHPKRYIITRVHFYLPAAWSPRLRYADLAAAFANRHAPTAEEVMVAVCKIRNRKLPDPKLIGNAGSFFQNPIVSNTHLLTLKEQYPKIVSYTESPTHSKLAAGWLIDQCGFKGMQSGAVGVHDQQALVLTHRGNGSASELLALAKTIQGAVKERFGVDLVIEPVVYK